MTLKRRTPEVDPPIHRNSDGNQSGGSINQPSSGYGSRASGCYSDEDSVKLRGVVASTSEMSVMHSSEKSDVNCQLGGDDDQPPPEIFGPLPQVLIPPDQCNFGSRVQGLFDKNK